MAHIILLFVLLCGVVQAAEPSKTTVAALCRQLVNHEAAADVAYQSGLDAHGNAVVGADLDDGQPPMRLPETTTIQLTLNQAQLLGINSTAPYTPEAYIGEVTVAQDGTVYFNRQRLSTDKVQMLCDNKKAQKPLINNEKPFVPADVTP